MAKFEQAKIAEGQGSSYIKQGVVDTFSSDVIEFFGGMAAEKLTESRIKGAEEASRTLLDEYVGGSATRALDKQQAGIEEQLMNVNDDPRGEQVTPPTTTSPQAVAALKHQRAELDKKKLAVAQGLMTEADYRIKAEQLYYQQVALSPGLKSELSAALTGILGIAPQGQLANVTMAARKAAASAQAGEDKKIMDIMKGRGEWDNDLTPQQNIDTRWDVVAEQLRVEKKLERDGKLLSNTSALDTQARAKLERSIMSEGSQYISNMLPKISSSLYVGENQINIFKMSTEEIIALGTDTQGNLASQITANSNALRQQVRERMNRYGFPVSKAEDQMKTIAENEKLMIDLVMTTQLNEATLGTATRVKNIEAIREQAALDGLRLTNPQMMMLADIASVLPLTQILPAMTQFGTELTDILIKSNLSLDNVTPENKEAIEAKLVKNVTQLIDGVNAAVKLPDNRFQAATIFPINLSNTATENLGEKGRVALFKLAANKEYMTKLRTAAPEQYAKFEANMLRHQAAFNKGWHKTKLTELITSNAPKGTTLKDFHIEKGTSGMYNIVLNTAAGKARKEQLASTEGRRTFLGGAQATETDADVGGTLRNQMNLDIKNPIDAMVKSRVNFYNDVDASISYIAQELGISISDVTESTTEEKVGFGDTMKRPTDTVPKNTTENTSTTKLEDGAHVINDVLVQVVNGVATPVQVQ